MSGLYTAMTLEGPDGVDVALMQGAFRKIRRVEGIAGVRVKTIKRPRVGGRGQVNRTLYRDEAVVTIDGILTGDTVDRVWAEYNEVTRAYVGAVDQDRTLKWVAGDGLYQQAQVRLDGMTAAAEVGPRMIAYQATLSMPSGTVFSQTLLTGQTTLGQSGGGGLVFPAVFPVVFAPAASGILSAENAGSTPTPLLFTFTGPLVNPRVALGDRQLTFACTLAAGEQLMVDTQDKTVLLGGTASRRNWLVFDQSTWFELPPGVSVLRFFADSFSAGHAMTVEYRHAYE